MKNLSLYIHIPFCKSKCKYCDFLSFESKNILMDPYINALTNEIKNYSSMTSDYCIKSIFIGGGTPSILSTEHINKIFYALRQNYTIDTDSEITIEANPGTLNEEKIRTYKNCGINRISMGLQSCNNEQLKTLGRIHTYEDFVSNYNMIRKIGINNINVDLMFGLPDQTLKDWKQTLNRIVELRPEHISCYSLIVEEDTPFYRLYNNNQLNLPDEELERELYHEAQYILYEQGYKHYEISNFSLPGNSCYHNTIYWQLEEYIGLGLGASSYFLGERYKNVNSIKKYIEYNGNQKLLKEEVIPIDKTTKIEEYMFLGLRLLEGIDMNAFESTFHNPIDYYYNDLLKDLAKKDLLIRTNNTIKLTAKGLDISNYVLKEFLFDK